MMMAVFYGPDSTVAKESQTNKGLEVVNSIYSDIMGGSAKESQLGASLAAEVLIRDTWLRFSSLEILKQRWIT
jgi:hypothetical protein